MAINYDISVRILKQNDWCLNCKNRLRIRRDIAEMRYCTPLRKRWTAGFTGSKAVTSHVGISLHKIHVRGMEMAGNPVWFVDDLRFSMDRSTKRGKRCVAFGCGNTNLNEGISLHAFPRDKGDFRQWVKFCCPKRRQGAVAEGQL